MTGKGHAMVVVRPGNLGETMKVLEACLEADVAIIPQGAMCKRNGWPNHISSGLAVCQCFPLFSHILPVVFQKNISQFLHVLQVLFLKPDLYMRLLCIGFYY